MPEDSESNELSPHSEIEEIESSRLADHEAFTGEPAQNLLRAALGQFATGVTIVTTIDKSGENIGLTVNSFNSVSLDPPLVLWSIAETSYGIDAFRSAEHFCVNVLCAEQMELARLFSQASENKFKNLKSSFGLKGIPLIDGCLAHFECATEARYPGGDHLILLGRVMRYKSTNKAPILFHAGQYFSLAPRKIQTTRELKPSK